MKDDFLIAPLRDLPPGRLAQRRGHLISEIRHESGPDGLTAHSWSLRAGSLGRRRVVVLAVTMLVVIIGTASAIGSVRDFVLDRGFVGLPPEGATPSSPESSDLVAQWMGGNVRTWVYADGRIIWDYRVWHGTGRISEGANEFTSGYLEQRLAPEGVELVRAAARELIDRSRSLVEEIPIQDDAWFGRHHPRFALFVPNDFVSGGGVVALPDGDRSARLLWTNETKASPFQGTQATPEQLSALRRLAALFTDPASVLPSSAWAVRKVRAYVPSHYAVCIDTSPPKDASELLSLLPVRAAELLRNKTQTRSAGGTEAIDDGTVLETPGVIDCYKVDAKDAREVADALSGLPHEEGWGTYWLRWRVDEAPDGTQAAWNPTDITIEPYFPDGRIALSGPYG